jgi:hypothetical protein
MKNGGKNTWLVVAFFSLSSTEVAIRVVTFVALMCGTSSPTPSCGSAFKITNFISKEQQV